MAAGRTRGAIWSRVALALLMLLISLQAVPQSNVRLLERSITITLDNVPMGEALKRVSREAGVTFSYSSKLFDESQPVTQRFTNQTIREILDELFKGAIEYRERGKYIILIRGKEKVAETDPKMLSGYVIDEATGQRLRNVSVYDPTTLASAVTDEYGFFKLEIKNPTAEEVRLAVKKAQYTDTLVVVPKKNRQLLKIPIKFDADRIETMADSVGSKFTRFFNRIFQAAGDAVNMENIRDTIYRKTQFGFVPFIGTNGGLSGNVINDYSFNMFGGYSLGNRVFEFGGLFNANRGNVSGVQIAGLANGVLGRSDAVQVAGLLNLGADEVYGAQISGLANVALASARGSGIAGMANVSLGDQRGVYVAGFANVSTGASGPVQMAGFTNLSKGEFRGAQVAGFTNVVTSNLKGAQISGFANVADGNVSGAQVASFFNFGRDVSGTQIGLFNYARSMRGVPVGLLSFVAKGYHKLEISADEIFYLNVAFRTGVRHFYNILTVGAKPQSFDQEQSFWTFGYGIGTAPKLAKWLSLNVDVTSSQIVYGKIEKINLLNKVYTGLDFHLTKNFSVFGGITLNGQVTDRFYTEYPELFTHYEPSIIEERTLSNDLHLRMWWGGKVGIRFF